MIESYLVIGLMLAIFNLVWLHTKSFVEAEVRLFGSPAPQASKFLFCIALVLFWPVYLLFMMIPPKGRE